MLNSSVSTLAEPSQDEQDEFEKSDDLSLEKPPTGTVEANNENEEEEEEEAEDVDIDSSGNDFFSTYSKYHTDIGKTRGPTKRFSYANYFNDEFDEEFGGYGGMLTSMRTSADFAAQTAESLDEAVMRAREMVNTVGTLNSGHGNVPINPMGTPHKRAAAIAQAMIERMSTVEDDETRMQDEFKYDTKRLLKLQLNPMRGIQSAKVGRSKAPVSIFLDYSGSCEHVNSLFGLILVGFANEGATVLIGGNGVVNAVYHPFPNRPLAHYSADMKVIGRYSIGENVRVKAGLLVTCVGSNLQDLTVGPLIACTDFDSYQALMARPRKTTHIILALHAVHSNNVRSTMAQGQVELGGNVDYWIKNVATTQQKKTSVSLYTQTQNLALHQTVYPVHDLETLTTMLRSSR